MKRIIIIVILLFIMPILVNAETLTYDVCDTCEYSSSKDIQTAINSLGDLTDKQIVINVNGDYFNFIIGSTDNIIESTTINFTNTNNSFSKAVIYSKEIVINGNGVTFDVFTPGFLCDSLTMKDIHTKSDTVYIANTKYLDIQNSNIDLLFLQYYDYQTNDIPSEEFTVSVNGESLNSVNSLWISGNVKMYNVSLKNTTLVNVGGTTNLYECSLNKVLNYTENTNTKTNIYNPLLKTLKYKIFKDENDGEFPLFMQYMNDRNASILNYDFYGFQFPEYNIDVTSNIFFSKMLNIQKGEIFDLTKWLDYYTEDKEISYTIEDESIAKIENKELIGLKPGNTKVQVTTDEGHVIYNIDLTVYTISEKKVTMKAETKLKLNSIFKDLDISSINDDVWEISNPKVAKIVNGEIVSLSKGETDIVAIIDGVKYVYHLTVSDTLVTKEIKVPITGNSIKLWIVIVTILLLSVIGICTYVLLKSKKAK